MTQGASVARASNHGVPDYETYDFATTWKGRSVEDSAERRLVRLWAGEGGAACIELGGGFGRITQDLERLFRRTFMLDYSRRNLLAASRKLRNTTLVRCGLARLPFPESSFEFIALIRVMHHIPEPSRLLSEVARVGRNGGTFVMSVPNPFTGRLKRTGGAQGHVAWRGPQGHVIFATRLEAYSNPGLELEEIRGVGLFDNRLGSKLERLSPLSAFDLLTSRLWPVKSQLFLRFSIRKEGSSKPNEPLVACNCGGTIVDGRCRRCGRKYGAMIDLVEEGGANLGQAK